MCGGGFGTVLPRSFLPQVVKDTVNIQIGDVNDNSPIFHGQPYTVHIPEVRLTGSHLTLLIFASKVAVNKKRIRDCENVFMKIPDILFNEHQNNTTRRKVPKEQFTHEDLLQQRFLPEFKKMYENVYKIHLNLITVGTVIAWWLQGMASLFV